MCAGELRTGLLGKPLRLVICLGTPSFCHVEGQRPATPLQRPVFLCHGQGGRRVCLSVVGMSWQIQAAAIDPREERMEDPRGWDLDQVEGSPSLGHA